MTAVNKQSKIKRISRVASWIVAGLFALIIAGVLFVKLVPGYGLYIVRSDSMSPTIKAGDVIITGPADSINAGQIITFENKGKIVTHRAVNQTQGQIVTKGDANEEADAGTISMDSVKGAYLFKVPAVGYITSLTKTKMGWFLMVILPAAILVGFLVKDILKEAFKDDRKKATAHIVAESSGLMQTITAGADINLLKEIQPGEKSKSSYKLFQKKPAVRPAKQAKEEAPRVFHSAEADEVFRSEIRRIFESK